jgi:predicted ATPase
MSATSFFLVSYVSSDLHEESTNASLWTDPGAPPTTVSLPLHASADERGGLKVTIVIGSNGSGKSTAIASLAEELEVMAELLGRTDQDSRRRRALMTTHATIEYRSDGRLVKLTREGVTLSVEMDGQRADRGTVPFPSNVLAVAHLPADKFRFSRYQKGQPFYRYLGLRQATNLSTTGSLETAVIASLLAGRDSLAHQSALQGWLSDVGIEDEFLIELAGIDERVLVARDLQGLIALATGATESKFLDDPMLFFSESDPGFTREMIDRGLARFFEQLRGMATRSPWASSKTSRARPSLVVPIRALSPSMPGEPVSLQTGFDLLRKMRLARAVNLIVTKAGRVTPFAQLSSGERQILGTATRLIEHAVDGSVILIDEPEVSLHPTWQIAYVPRLLQALGHLHAGHVVIATHSHFMVSDVDEAASLTVATQDSVHVRRQFERFEEGVYGRTPENILYRVFGVGTASNFYVEQDLATALQMISGTAPADAAVLRTMRARLEKVRGPDNPAFEEILRLIDQYLETGPDA